MSSIEEELDNIRKKFKPSWDRPFDPDKSKDFIKPYIIDPDKRSILRDPERIKELLEAYRRRESGPDWDRHPERMETMDLPPEFWEKYNREEPESSFGWMAKGGRVGLALGGDPYMEDYRNKEADIIPAPGDEMMPDDEQGLVSMLRDEQDPERKIMLAIQIIQSMGDRGIEIVQSILSPEEIAMAVKVIEQMDVASDQGIDNVQMAAEGGRIGLRNGGPAPDEFLAYINRDEADLLKAHGGSGRMTDQGIPSFERDVQNIMGVDVGGQRLYKWQQKSRELGYNPGQGDYHQGMTDAEHQAAMDAPGSSIRASVEAMQYAGIPVPERFRRYMTHTLPKEEPETPIVYDTPTPTPTPTPEEVIPEAVTPEAVTPAATATSPVLQSISPMTYQTSYTTPTVDDPTTNMSQYYSDVLSTPYFDYTSPDVAATPAANTAANVAAQYLTPQEAQVYAANGGRIGFANGGDEKFDPFKYSRGIDDMWQSEDSRFNKKRF